MVHPEDRQFLRDTIDLAIQQSTPFQFESRYTLPNGQCRLFFTRGLPLLDETGKTATLVGVVQDVTELKLTEAKLRNSDDLLAQAEEMAGLGSWELDVINWTVTCSRECFRMLNLKPSSGPVPLGEIWSVLHLGDLEVAKQALDNAINANIPLEHVSQYVMPNGTTRILHSRGHCFTDANGRVLRVVGFNHDITEQTRIENNYRRLSRQLLTLRSEEQRRVSRELHETASQTLTAVKMTLRQIGDRIPQSDSASHDLLQQCRNLAADAIREVRTISAILHPPMLDKAGLVSGLRSYTKLFSERSGLPVGLNIPEDLQRLPKEIDLTIFCIIQEALSNVHRHARARSAEIRIGALQDS
jgi:signal transduction histidine kinase